MIAENVRTLIDLPEIPPNNRMKNRHQLQRPVLITFLLALVLLWDACSVLPPPGGNVIHVVLLWLKDPHSKSDRAQLVRRARSLRMMPGVLQVQTGRKAPTPPTGVGHDFDLAVMITFRDRMALERYNIDPRNQAALRHYLKPLVRHYVVYNLPSP